MIEKVNILQLFPRYLLDDRDGYAMCRALEAGMNYFLEHAKTGMDIILDVDEMPEWRLDELAWEYNCLYDYDADITIKKEWIRNAYESFRYHGTAEGVRQYMSRYFGESSIQEWFEFEGDPGTFNVTVAGTMTAANEAWIRKAVAKAKNVRSELNLIIYGDECETDMIYSTGVSGIVMNDTVQMIEEEEE